MSLDHLRIGETVQHILEVELKGAWPEEAKKKKKKLQAGCASQGELP